MSLYACQHQRDLADVNCGVCFRSLRTRLEEVEKRCERYRKALNEIQEYGHPLEYPKADSAIGRIQGIVKEALSTSTSLPSKEGR